MGNHGKSQWKCQGLTNYQWAAGGASWLRTICRKSLPLIVGVTDRNIASISPFMVCRSEGSRHKLITFFSFLIPRCVLHKVKRTENPRQKEGKRHNIYRDITWVIQVSDETINIKASRSTPRGIHRFGSFWGQRYPKQSKASPYGNVVNEPLRYEVDKKFL